MELLALEELRYKIKLEQLLDAISACAITDVEELDQHEVDLLEAYSRDDEPLEVLIKRLHAVDACEPRA